MGAARQATRTPRAALSRPKWQETGGRGEAGRGPGDTSVTNADIYVDTHADTYVDIHADANADAGCDNDA